MVFRRGLRWVRTLWIVKGGFVGDRVEGGEGFWEVLGGRGEIRIDAVVLRI